MIINLPKLRIVKVNSLLLHEIYDPKRTDKLVDKIPKDKIFINPVIVGKVPREKKLVLLDGANRLEAVKKLGFRDILIQEVNYLDPQEVELSYSRHYLAFSINQQKTLLAEIKKIKGIDLKPIGLDLARKKAQGGFIIGYIKLDAFNKTYSFGSHKDLLRTTKILNQVVNLYAGKTEIYRLNELQYPKNNLSVEIGFRKYRPLEVLKIAKNHLRINSGLTRHLINNCAIHINIPIKILKSKQSIRAKNIWLDKFIKDKMDNKEIRLYQRPIYIFDEWKKER